MNCRGPFSPEVNLQCLQLHVFALRVLTCLSVRARHLRTTSPSSALFSSVLSSSVKYLASRVCPCLFTSRRNLIVMEGTAEGLSPLPQKIVHLRCQIGLVAGFKIC
jgi:hypothetical protein